MTSQELEKLAKLSQKWRDRCNHGAYMDPKQICADELDKLVQEVVMESYKEIDNGATAIQRIYNAGGWYDEDNGQWVSVKPLEEKPVGD